MSIIMSVELSALAIDLSSMTIDSPTDRTNAKGEAIRPTVYFTNGVVDKATGKLVAGKKSTLYTPNEQEATALKATCVIVEALTLNGTKYHFLKSAVVAAGVSGELKNIKGMLASNRTITDIKKSLKRLAGAYIAGMSSENRCMVADAIAELTVPALDGLRNQTGTDEDSPLF